MSRSIDQGLTLAALERALVTATPALHHSDQGVQYAATAYVERLQNLGVTLSMAAVGEPRENGYAERLMRTIKEEEVDLSEYHDFADARRQIGRFLDDVYNVKRIHSSLGYLTPREFEQQWHAPTTASTTTLTWAEDRAPVGTDPSADPALHAHDRDGTVQADNRRRRKAQQQIVKPQHLGPIGRIVAGSLSVDGRDPGFHVVTRHFLSIGRSFQMSQAGHGVEQRGRESLIDEWGGTH